MAIPKLKFEITADDKSQAALAGVAKSVTGITSSLKQLATGGAVAGLVALTAASAQAADDLADFAAQIDISTEALSQYEFIAGRAGISNETLEQSFAKMTKNVAAAAAGAGNAGKAFAELGLKAAQLKTLKPDQQFEVIAEALSRVASQGDRARLAQEIFGKGGVSLIRIVGDGAKGLAEMRKQADALGITLSQEVADQFGKTADSIDAFNASMKASGRIIAEIFSPALSGVASFLADKMPKAARAFQIGLQSITVGVAAAGGAIGKVFGAENSFAFATDAAEQMGVLINAFKGTTVAAKETELSYKDFIGVGIKLADQVKLTKEQQKELNEVTSAAKGYFDATRTAQEKELITLQELDKLLSKKAISFETYARAGLQAEIAAEEALNALSKGTDAAADKARTDDLQKRKQYVDDTRTAAEKYLATQTELNRLFDSGAKDFDTYARAGLQAEIALEEATEGVGPAMSLAAKEANDALKKIQQQTDQLAISITDRFFEAGQSIKGFFYGVLEDISKAIFKAAVGDKLSSALGGLIAGAFGGGSSGSSGFSDFSALGFGRAKGGPTFDRPFIVGERGPEIMSGPGTVSALGAAGGVNITFQVNSLDPRSAASVIVANRDAIVGVIKGAFGRAGTAARLA
jgi:hypothetical protein